MLPIGEVCRWYRDWSSHRRAAVYVYPIRIISLVFIGSLNSVVSLHLWFCFSYIFCSKTTSIHSHSVTLHMLFRTRCHSNLSYRSNEKQFCYLPTYSTFKTKIKINYTYIYSRKTIYSE